MYDYDDEADYDDDEPGRPEDDDYIISSDTWRGVYVVQVGRGTVSNKLKNERSAWRWIQRELRGANFFPNVWVEYDRTEPQLVGGIEDLPE